MRSRTKLMQYFAKATYGSAIEKFQFLAKGESDRRGMEGENSKGSLNDLEFIEGELVCHRRESLPAQAGLSLCRMFKSSVFCHFPRNSDTPNNRLCIFRIKNAYFWNIFLYSFYYAFPDICKFPKSSGQDKFVSFI